MAVNEATARLQIGDMEKGLGLWELRPDFEKGLCPIPLWQGQEVKHLLLHENQGLGDAIQLLRYIPLLKNYAKQIEICVREPLQRLCAENFPETINIGENVLASTADARCRWSSLPFFFGTRLDNIPPAPYLTAVSERRSLWCEKLHDLPKPRIGLVWAGNKKWYNDGRRSLNTDSLRPLLKEGAGHLVSIQKERAEKMEVTLDAGPLLGDFTDTAALMCELDLIIAVDTSTAHLAGALGRPVFILLPFDSDWRWLLGREDSPWYPSARLFRQTKPNDWDSVISIVAHEVKKFIAGDTSVLQAKRWQGENLRQNPHALPLPL